MHSNCILDSVANLLVRHMVFVGNIQKSPIASQLNGLEPFLNFCYQGPALTGIKEGRYDERPHQLNHMIFSLERTAVVWAILERILGFDPSLEMIAQRYLKFSTSSSLWPFILISLWKPFGLFVITFVLSWPIYFVPCDGCIKTVYQDFNIFFLFCIFNNVICRTEVGNKSSSDADTIYYLHGHPMPHTWFSQGRC